MSRQNPIILIIEDEQALVMAIAKKFALAGFDVVTACDADQAIDYLNHLDPLPAAIWLDHFLQKRDGADFLTEVRQHEAWKEIPVFIVTNMSDQTPYAGLLDDGRTTFLTKADHRLDEAIENVKQEISN